MCAYVYDRFSGIHYVISVFCCLKWNNVTIIEYIISLWHFIVYLRGSVLGFCCCVAYYHKLRGIKHPIINSVVDIRSLDQKLGWAQVSSLFGVLQGWSERCWPGWALLWRRWGRICSGLLAVVDLRFMFLGWLLAKGLSLLLRLPASVSHSPSIFRASNGVSGPPHPLSFSQSKNTSSFWRAHWLDQTHLDHLYSLRWVNLGL